MSVLSFFTANDNEPYLYKIVGSWGFSPNPQVRIYTRRYARLCSYMCTFAHLLQCTHNTFAQQILTYSWPTFISDLVSLLGLAEDKTEGGIWAHYSPVQGCGCVYNSVVEGVQGSRAGPQDVDSVVHNVRVCLFVFYVCTFVLYSFFVLFCMHLASNRLPVHSLNCCSSYMDEQGLLCLYPNLPHRHGFAANWREDGEHEMGVVKARSTPLQMVCLHACSTPASYELQYWTAVLMTKRARKHTPAYLPT